MFRFEQTADLLSVIQTCRFQAVEDNSAVETATTQTKSASAD
ncbi:MAG: hypothetical protein ACBR13_15320 [Microcoleus sp.]